MQSHIYNERASLAYLLNSWREKGRDYFFRFAVSPFMNASASLAS